MTTQETAVLDPALNDMLLNEQFLDAFERFYHPEVVMQENTGDPVTGKDANREKELAFFGSVDKVNEFRLLSTAVHGDRSFSEWAMHLTFKDGSEADITQVAARRWQDGLIVHERFYHAG